jgi:hypothetical protein
MIGIHKHRVMLAMSIAFAANFTSNLVHAQDKAQSVAALSASVKKDICKQLESKEYIFVYGDIPFTPNTKISIGDLELNQSPQANEPLDQKNILLLTRQNIFLDELPCGNSVCVSKKKITSLCAHANTYQLNVSLDPLLLGVGPFSVDEQIVLFNKKEQRDIAQSFALTGTIHAPRSELVFSQSEVSSFLEGRTSALAVSIRNSGDRVLKIRDFAEVITSDNGSSPITIGKNTCAGKALEPNQTCSLKFQRQSPSRRLNYEIAFESNDVMAMGRLMMSIENNGTTRAGIWHK